MVHNFLYEQPPSLVIKIMPLLSFLGLAYLGYLESRGKHLQYSKFLNVNNNVKNKFSRIKLSTKLGMFMSYAPSCVVAFASFFIFPYEDGGIRFFLKFVLTTHFLKRVLEVLFVHKYTGGMSLFSFIVISASYPCLTIGMLCTQHMTHGLQEPLIDIKYFGIVLFFIGITGNFYHHYLLSNLRANGEKGYKIPKGGLFGLVICPHYLFEICAFFGIFIISQTMAALSSAVGSALYLVGRSYATRKWYLSKFEEFPEEIKALIPCVF